MSAVSTTRSSTYGAVAALAPMAVVALLWGFNWPVVRILLSTCGPWTLRAAGLTGGAVVLLTAAAASGTTLAIPRRHWRDVAIAALLNVTIFNACTVFAQLSMPTSRAAIVTFTMPVWATLFAWAMLGEQIDRRRLAALAIGIGGLGVLAVPFWPVIAKGGVPFGLVYVLGAAMSWALGTVWLKGHRIVAAPLAITAWQVVIAAVICTLAMVLFERPRLDLSAWPQATAFVYHIALSQGLAYLIWFDLVGRVPAATAALGTLMVPVFGVLGAVVLLGDWPGPLDIVGLALIVGAVTMDQARPSPAR